ncbi:MAG: DMT family transporter, partial [Candidatus Adiutricales bacterium]
MDTRILKANAILFLAAVLFGSVFVAQRIAMDHLGPFSYTGIRFALGAFCLAPVAWYRSRRSDPPEEPTSRWQPVWASLVSGGLMCLTINLQQIGLVYTTAGKAGFITGLYIIIVPLLRLFWGKRPGLGLWAGASLGATGLYFLSVS